MKYILFFITTITLLSCQSQKEKRLNKLNNLQDLYKSETEYGDALIDEWSHYSDSSNKVDTFLINRKLDTLKVEKSQTKKSIDSILALE